MIESGLNMASNYPEHKSEKFYPLGEISYSWTIPEKEAVYVPMPEFISDNIKRTLSVQNIRFLYKHQLDALKAITSGKNIVISTGTSSGKSLCYQIPILELLLSDSQSTALLIFPTKALAQDQRQSLVRMIPEKTSNIMIYDGDTPSYQRTAIRKTARVIITNPDMLHLGILPYHVNWSHFLQQLQYIVIDEVHIYRGIFGSHTANVFRRLDRILHRYKSQIHNEQYILCSATLSNARVLAEKLIGSPMEEFSEDTSGKGKRSILFINPPIVDDQLHLRAGSIHTSARLSADILKKKDHQLLIFSQSRQSVETAVRRLRDLGVEVNGYRSGYLPKERRKIEQGLKQGKDRCVVATNALELGMDIGEMDSVISIGYPGSIASFYQRMGRAGRNQQDSSFYLVGSQNPVDQYLMKHPEFIQDHTIEPALIDPDNLLILFQHLQCALFEFPFSEGESFGNLSIEATRDILDYLVSSGVARKSGGQYFWFQSDLPQKVVSLRNSSLDQVNIISEDLLGKKIRIGIVDRLSSYWMVHEGAIYFHNGEPYRIRSLDLEENIALAEKFNTWYTTDAIRNCQVTPGKIIESRDGIHATIYVAEVTVTDQVTGYRKRDIETYQILDQCPLSLPEEKLDTKSFLIVLKKEFQEYLVHESLWNNEINDYGRNWPIIRSKIIQRDQFSCQLCGIQAEEKFLQVHHIVPFRNFSNPDSANQSENLITLCRNCHQRVEAAVKMRSGLSGFASALHHMASLFLECDLSDLNVIADPENAAFQGLPTIYIYETIPGGIGLSQSIFQNTEKIIQATLDLITNCECEDGCPGCIGPAGEIGIGGKKEALAIGNGLSNSKYGEDSLLL
jgi:DEAD/DEAH box helicase domain-containing protein